MQMLVVCKSMFVRILLQLGFIRCFWFKIVGSQGFKLCIHSSVWLSKLVDGSLRIYNTYVYLNYMTV